MLLNSSLFFALSNLRLLKGDGSELSQEDLIKLWEFYNLMIGSTNSSLISRGESDRNLMKQFNVDSQNPIALAECLFMTGEKGRICWAENGGMDPDDLSTENFLNICQSLAKYIDEGMNSGGNRAKRIKVFCEREDKFCKGLKNKAAIVKAYEKLKPEDKRKVNLIYLALAHTINDREYKETSGYLSTTTNDYIADRFAKDACIYGWVPKNTWNSRARRRTIDLVDTNNSLALRHTGLPFCESAVFPEQREIAIRCGLLPHFIIGFTVGRCFYVNTAIFTAIGKMHGLSSFRELSSFRTNIQQFGLEINQENFEEFCQRTNFKRFYTFDGENYTLYKVVHKQGGSR